ncbi:IS66 family insertion sequence element accessory protein TnpB [Sphingobium sp. YC-XJ3]|uniref:IS66 family insertion sequence element accessory protein TnpB n=1 Tax=Sphingobium sp. YC-XJ3 TaxID=3024245 RepID=UPI0030813EB2
MIPLPPSTRIFLACGATDMRKGFDGLAVMAQQVLEQSPHSGALFAFRGKRGDLVKLLWYDGQGMCLFSKRMDRGRFVWPSTKTGSVVIVKRRSKGTPDRRRRGTPFEDMMLVC